MAVVQQQSTSSRIGRDSLNTSQGLHLPAQGYTEHTSLHMAIIMNQIYQQLNNTTMSMNMKAQVIIERKKGFSQTFPGIILIQTHKNQTRPTPSICIFQYPHISIYILSSIVSIFR